MVNKVFSLLLALTLPIGIISGLFVAPWICLIIGVMLYCVAISGGKRHPGLDPGSHKIRLEIATAFLMPRNDGSICTEILIILYALASCFWSIAPKTSILIFLQLGAIIFLARFLVHKVSFPINHRIILAITIFYIEKFSNGFISQFFRSLTSNPKGFHLSWLDRGCSLISITTWPMIYMLIKDGRRLLAGLVYAIVLIMLLQSDNMAGLVGYLLASIGYMMLTLSRMKLAWLIKFSVMLYIVIMPIASKLEDPRFIAKEYGNVIPISYIHRLLIWNFVATEALEHPVFGQGIGTAKFTPIKDENRFFYKDEMLSPLPLHPHNNVLQIFLELGLVGLGLFAIYIWQIMSKIRNISVTNEDISWGASGYALFINYFFIGMVSFGFWQSWWMLSILFVMVLMGRPNKNCKDRYPL